MEQRRSPGSFQEQTLGLGTDSFPRPAPGHVCLEAGALPAVRGGTCHSRGRGREQSWTELKRSTQPSAALVPTHSRRLPGNRSLLCNMLWRGSQALRHFSTGRVSPVKASIHILVLLSRLKGLQGRDGEAGVGSDAQTLLEGTTPFFRLGDSRAACGSIRDGNCQVSLCLLRGISCRLGLQIWLGWQAGGTNNE